MRKNALSVVLACALSGIAGTASAAGLPDWMLGDWPVRHVFQDDDKPYPESGGPNVWWKDKSLRVESDRLVFDDTTCEGTHATLQQGEVSTLLHATTRETFSDLGMPVEKGTVIYYKVRCDHVLVQMRAFQGHPTHTNELDNDKPWYLIVRSKTELAMPYRSWSFIVFGRAGPST